jgi:hypothetical protein
MGGYSTNITCETERMQDNQAIGVIKEIETNKTQTKFNDSHNKSAHGGNIPKSTLGSHAA